MKICLFIPTYQAESTLDQLLGRIPSDLWSHLTLVVLVDDGSTDGTSEVVRKWMGREKRIQLVQHQRNLGYGASVRDGLLAARDWGCDHAVCLHADGQYPPEQVLPLVQRMEQHSLDVLQGSRHLSGGGARQGGMPLYKIVAGKVLVKLENAVFGMNLTDYHSGFLFYSRNALERIPFTQLSASFDFDLQVIACACALGLAVGEEAIPTRYSGEVSHLNPITYGLRVVRVLWKYHRGEFHHLCRTVALP